LNYHTTISAISGIAALIALIIGFAPPAALAQGPGCPRGTAGAVVSDPPSVTSRNGVLRVSLSYNTATDGDGRTLYCFTALNGEESPTLYARPGDVLLIQVRNDLPTPATSTAMGMQTSMTPPSVCGASVMNDASVNVHFHGTNTSPVCHQDEVIRTLINSGETFSYRLQIPFNEPPGLYWYHPHVHGISEAAVQGGASGAIVITGIQNVQPKVAGLAQQILIVRDQIVPNPPDDDPNVPGWDVSLNYIPISYPAYIPAVILMPPGKKQLWRVVNAGADTILDLQLRYDGVPQTLELVALDGVPTGSQNGTRRGTTVDVTDILLPPAGRAEFIVMPPAAGVQDATLMTLNVDTGPDGDIDPQRPLASVQLLSPSASSARTAARGATPLLPSIVMRPGPQRFEGLAKAAVTAQRKLFFSEFIPADPTVEPTFFITVDGQTPTAFDPNNPPAITTTQGAVEEWTIENRSGESHEFHIHQIHFLLEAINGVPVPPEQQQFLDMINVPFWTGAGPFPSVTVRLDFRGRDIGDFVYHCHILEHEDNGMMAIIRVLPKGSAAAATPLAHKRRSLASNKPLKVATLK
jgi:FtsP/CotA-like multicopper oxidase with cupredoxin domain